MSVICFLVLALFLTLRLRGRVHETGVYLAMGISKSSVLMQYLLEVFLAAALALLLAYGASTAISNQIGSGLLSQVTAQTYETVDLTGDIESVEEPTTDLGLSEIKVTVSARDLLIVCAFGMVLCIASTDIQVAAAPRYGTVGIDRRRSKAECAEAVRGPAAVCSHCPRPGQ